MLEKKGNRVLIRISIFLFLIFLVVIAMDRLSYKNRNIKLSDSIDIFAKNVKKEKGVVIINDSLVLQGNCFQIVKNNVSKTIDSTESAMIGLNRQFRIYDLSGPYQLVKPSGNDTILVIVRGDSLYFKFLDIGD